MNVVFVLAFVVLLLLSVMLHEAGHFFTARHYGMKATQFFVGFGPTLWSRTSGETEYGIKAVPAGGFVKIIGMTPLEEIEAGDEDRVFFKHKPGPKTVVLAAGSTVHFLLAILFVFLAVAGFGGLQKTGAPTLAAISDCVGSKPVPGCTQAGAIEAPAKKAGLEAKDVVIKADGKTITSADQLTKVIKASAGLPVHLVVRRAGKPVAVTVTPASITRPDATKAIGAIGVSVAENFYTPHYGFFGTFKETGVTLGSIVKSTATTLTQKLGTITQVYDKNRPPDGFVGVVGAARVTGDIGGAKGVGLGSKVDSLLILIAGLNLFVGVFNLLPLLPLDGGHIAVVFFEAVRDKLKRAGGYVGDVIRVDYNKLTPITFAVVVLFAGFTLWILGADIVNPIKLTQ